MLIKNFVNQADSIKLFEERSRDVGGDSDGRLHSARPLESYDVVAAAAAEALQLSTLEAGSRVLRTTKIQTAQTNT